MRALRAGFVHVLDDATFVYHAGQRSFGAAATRLVRRALRVAAGGRIPSTCRPSPRFMREDPLRAARERVREALRPPRRPLAPGLPATVVHVVHGWPPWNSAGTEVYARGLALRQAREPRGGRLRAHRRHRPPARRGHGARRRRGARAAASSTTSPSGTRCRATPSATARLAGRLRPLPGRAGARRSSTSTTWPATPPVSRACCARAACPSSSRCRTGGSPARARTCCCPAASCAAGPRAGEVRALPAPDRPPAGAR